MNAVRTKLDVTTALTRAADALARQQEPAGCWTDDYSGPLFLLPMYLTACYATGAMPDGDTQARMVRYIRSVQNPDGGFGLGEQNASCVFTTTLNYIALRMLGVPADDPACVRAKGWSDAQGGPLAAASWGKFFLALLHLYPWEGLNPTPPETWLLPYSLPVHPGRLWCHARQVYLPMAWLYGARASVPVTPLIRALREELYGQPWDAIDWAAARTRVAPCDAYAPATPLIRVVNRLLLAAEQVMPRAVRRRALDHVLDHIRYEDDTSDSICIGPVNKVLNLLVWHHVDPGGERVRNHLARLPDYLFTDDRGTRMNGYNNSQLWDTAFAMQALFAAFPRPDGGPLATLRHAHRYVDDNQVKTELPERDTYHRDKRQWAWPFSDEAHGWPITDCTAEGITAALMMRPHVDAPIDDARLAGAVDRLLERQNPDGGWASYEKIRGPQWLQQLNPSDIFGDIMLDHSFVECTAAVVHAFDLYRRRPGAAPDPRVDDAIRAARALILAKQEADGSWYGNWGVCFTYGTWFGVRGLLASGLTPDHPAIQRAADFLTSIQMADGGWGERIDSCRDHRVVPTDHGEPVMTAWAVMTLIEAGRGRSDAVRRGVEFLLERQLPDGTWPQDAIAGVFNHTCSITYSSYRKYFPLWALGLYQHHVG